jgi:hypothetical protein
VLAFAGNWHETLALNRTYQISNRRILRYHGGANEVGVFVKVPSSSEAAGVRATPSPKIGIPIPTENDGTAKVNNFASTYDPSNRRRHSIGLDVCALICGDIDDKSMPHGTLCTMRSMEVLIEAFQQKTQRGSQYARNRRFWTGPALTPGEHTSANTNCCTIETPVIGWDQARRRFPCARF